MDCTLLCGLSTAENMGISVFDALWSYLLTIRGMGQMISMSTLFPHGAVNQSPAFFSG